MERPANTRRGDARGAEMRLRRIVERLVEDVDAERGEVEHYRGPGDRRVDVRKQIRAGGAPCDAWNGDAREQSPIDIAHQDVARARGAGGKNLDKANGGRRARRRSSHDADEKRRRDDAERHAERAIDKLRRKSDRDEYREGTPVNSGKPLQHARAPAP